MCVSGNSRPRPTYDHIVNLLRRNKEVIKIIVKNWIFFWQQSALSNSPDKKDRTLLSSPEKAAPERKKGEAEEEKGEDETKVGGERKKGEAKEEKGEDESKVGGVTAALVKSIFIS